MKTKEKKQKLDSEYTWTTETLKTNQSMSQTSVSSIPPETSTHLSSKTNQSMSQTSVFSIPPETSAYQPSNKNFQKKMRVSLQKMIINIQLVIQVFRRRIVIQLKRTQLNKFN